MLGAPLRLLGRRYRATSATGRGPCPRIPSDFILRADVAVAMLVDDRSSPLLDARPEGPNRHAFGTHLPRRVASDRPPSTLLSGPVPLRAGAPVHHLDRLRGGDRG